MTVSNASRAKKYFIRIGLTLLILFFLGWLAGSLSPWPGALFFRYVFNKGAEKVDKALARHVPDGVLVHLDEHYDPADKDAFLDIYYPASIKDSDTALPVIVWIHGGGLISGNKGHVGNYCRILAAKGYIVAAIDYSVAPEKKYPVPIAQTHAALAYLKRNAARFQLDTQRFFIAGDSGGAHIAAQVGSMIYDPAYAGLMRITPALAPGQLSGLILFCGSYNALHEPLEGRMGGFFKTVLWAYSGKKNFREDAFFQTASIVDYVNEKFPRVFISAGNGDPLLPHSVALARKLSALRVPVDTLFFPAQHQPSLPHEYQFNLDNYEGKTALERVSIFLAEKP